MHPKQESDKFQRSEVRLNSSGTAEGPQLPLWGGDVTNRHPMHLASAATSLSSIPQFDFYHRRKNTVTLWHSLVQRGGIRPLTEEVWLCADTYPGSAAAEAPEAEAEIAAGGTCARGSGLSAPSSSGSPAYRSSILLRVVPPENKQTQA